MTDKEFLDNFMSEHTNNQTMQIAKAQDIVDKMNARIEKLISEQNRNNDTLKACDAVISSNAYPALSPIVSTFKEIVETSSKNKAKKIKKAEKKIKKANRKIKKAEKKLKKTHMLQDFVSALKNSDDKQTAFIDGTKAIKDDSLLRLNDKLDKIDVHLKAMSKKLQSGNVNNADTLKIKSRVQKLKSKKDKIIAKINNLNELEQSLNKLAKIELIKEKAEELANSAIETAEKAAMKTDNVSSIIDDIALSSSVSINNILDEEKTQTKDNSVNLEKSEKQPAQQKTEQTEKQLLIEHPVKRQVTQQQIKQLINANILVMSGKDSNNKLFAVFEKADTDKVNQILAQEQKKNQTRK